MTAAIADLFPETKLPKARNLRRKLMHVADAGDWGNKGLICPMKCELLGMPPKERDMIGLAGTFSAPKLHDKKREHDIYVQCTRCRNKHMESERIETAPDKYGLKTMACPRCGGHSYYKLDDNGDHCR